jgi:hypothetical protein
MLEGIIRKPFTNKKCKILIFVFSNLCIITKGKQSNFQTILNEFSNCMSENNMKEMSIIKKSTKSIIKKLKIFHK